MKQIMPLWQAYQRSFAMSANRYVDFYITDHIDYADTTTADAGSSTETA